MNSNQIQEIVKLFKSKAPAKNYMDACQMTHYGIKYGGIYLFDGDKPDSQRIASLSIKGVSADLMSVELIIGFNTIEFVEHHTLFMEILNRLIPMQSFNSLSNEKSKETALQANQKAIS
mgnify:CR=1 FL=1